MHDLCSLKIRELPGTMEDLTTSILILAAGRAVVWEGASALQKFPFAFAFVLPVSTGCG